MDRAEWKLPFLDGAWTLFASIPTMPNHIPETEAEGQLLFIMLWANFLLVQSEASATFLVLTCLSKARPKGTKKAVCFNKMEEDLFLESLNHVLRSPSAPQGIPTSTAGYF